MRNPSPLLTALFSLGLGLSASLHTGCGGSDTDGDFTAPEGTEPFGGRNIKFQSTYIYFPSDFSMALVRDTMPQADACRILKMYSSSKPPFPGLPVLPYEEEHYALVINVDSIHTGDDVTLDPTDRGGVADMRWAVLGLFPVGKNGTPYMHWPAGGYIRIADLTHYQHARGEFRLQFPGGEKTEQAFDVSACP